MNYIGKFISNFREFYNEINSATLTGAIDVVVVRQPDGTYLCSPFHVRFGKIGVLRSREKVVDIEVNGDPIDIHMKLGDSGEAFFVQEVEDEDDVVPVHLATSPLPPVPDIEVELRKMKASNRIMDTKNFTETSEHLLLEVRTLEDGTQDLHHSSSVNVRNSVIETSDDHNVVVQSIHNETVVCNGSLSSSPKSSFLELPKFANVCKVTKEEVSIGIQTEESTTETSATEKCVVKISTALNNESPTDSQDDLKLKKKRKKKTSAKKRTKSREISIPASRIDSDFRDVHQDIHSILKNNDDDVADEQEDIFQMDDDYDVDEGYPSLLNGLSRSVSLPVNSKQFSSYEWPVRKMSATFTGEFHPFSDGDVTPHSSPSGSRPPSPKSDTEYEIQKYDAMSQTDTREPSWGWGQLPNVPKQLNSSKTPSRQQADISSHIDDADKVQDNADEEKRSMLGGIIGFMRSTKKLRHMPESEGIYLDDINPDDLNPHVAALYFPKFKSSYHPQTDIKSPIQDEDAESGNGPSLPHSPHSVEGAIGGPHSIDSDTDDRLSCFDYYSDLAMSLCGGLQDIEAELPEDRFLHSIVTYDEFTENPAILQNPNLVIRMNGKYYNWSTAAPILLSIMMFQRPLPEKTTNQLIDEHMPKKKKSKSYSSWWYWRRIPPDADADVKKPESELSPSAQVALPPSQSSESSMSASPDKVFSLTPDKIASVNQHNVSLNLENSLTDPLHKNTSHIEAASVSINVDETILEVVSVEPSPVKDSPTARAEVTLSLPSNESSNLFSSQTKLDFGFERLKDEKQTSKQVEFVSHSTDYKQETIRFDEKIPRHLEKFKKSLRLPSDQIASLNLRKGPNEVVFSVTTAYQGTTRCKCHVYLWDCDDKIVISDIDGTITKSDVLGHILPIIGKDWAQMGVAKLFTTVKENGYQFLYLSARAIGQARITRDYLRSVRQGDLCLPDGPLLLSPTSLINALHREVIEKKPEEFKISCLRDIQALYPYSVGNPFYAGFGNKINLTAVNVLHAKMGEICSTMALRNAKIHRAKLQNLRLFSFASHKDYRFVVRTSDTFAYRAVGIPVSRIFTINHRGELKSELIQTFQSSYTRLSDVVDHMFPPMGRRNTVNGHLAPSFTASEEFSYFTYWRDPLPAVNEDDDLLVQR